MDSTINILSSNSYFFFHSQLPKPPLDWNQAARAIVKTQYPGSLDNRRLFFHAKKYRDYYFLSIIIADIGTIQEKKRQAVSAVPWLLEGVPQSFRSAWYARGTEWESWIRNDMGAWVPSVSNEVPSVEPEAETWILEGKDGRKSFPHWLKFPFHWRMRSRFLDDHSFQNKVTNFLGLMLGVQIALAALWMIFSLETLFQNQNQDFSAYEREWERLTQENLALTTKWETWNNRLARLPGSVISGIMELGKQPQDRILRVRQTSEEIAATIEGNDPYATLQLWLRNPLWQDVSISWPEASRRSVFTITARVATDER